MVASAMWVCALAMSSLLRGGSSLGTRGHLRSGSSGDLGHVFRYDYSKGGQDWVHGTCASRQRQSPVNLNNDGNAPTGKLYYSYSPTAASFDVTNTGHTFSASMKSLGYGGVTYENAWWSLEKVTVHAQSEHTFFGVHKPLELHLVHKKDGEDALLIVAVTVDAATPPPSFIQESALTNRTTRGAEARDGPVPSPAPGPAPAPALPLYVPPPATDVNFSPVVQMFLSECPPQAPGQTVTVKVEEKKPFDLSPLFQGGTFFEYTGSLTAPPCSEIVTWFVRQDSIMASDLQVQYIHDAIYHVNKRHGNSRQTMPLNGRSVKVRLASNEEPVPKELIPDIPLGDNPVTLKEAMAKKWAEDSLKLAVSSMYHIKDLDYRLRAGAEAHQSALTPNLLPEYLPTHPPKVPMSEELSDSEKMEIAKKIARVVSEKAKVAVAEAKKQLTADALKAAKVASKEAAAEIMDGLPKSENVLPP